ncbi:MAG TPA: hypothetical protein VJ323_15410 [Bryobacteraceae bacterium]|nr:hypothetical protein [Bryobacteraceae bacterium]
MHSIIWLLLFAPPCLALLTWLMTRGRKFMMMGNRSTPRIAAWQKYDFWIILAILYVVMFAAAAIEHKL